MAGDKYHRRTEYDHKMNSEFQDIFYNGKIIILVLSTTQDCCEEVTKMYTESLHKVEKCRLFCYLKMNCKVWVLPTEHVSFRDWVLESQQLVQMYFHSLLLSQEKGTA